MNKVPPSPPQDFGPTSEEGAPISDSWNMSKEREFMENLLGQRFNFYLLFISLTVVGFATTNNKLYGQLILLIGSVVAWMLTSVLLRSQDKLEYIMEVLFRNHSHPAKIIDQMVGGKSKRRLIGKWIPLVCSIFLTLGFLVHLCYLVSHWYCNGSFS